MGMWACRPSHYGNMGQVIRCLILSLFFAVFTMAIYPSDYCSASNIDRFIAVICSGLGAVGCTKQAIVNKMYTFYRVRLYEIYNVPFLRPALQPLYFYTMKFFLPLAALLLMASSGFCQTEARRTDSALQVRPLPYRPAYVYYNPNRPSPAYMSLLFEEEAKVLPRLYKANDFAGMRTYLDSVLQKSGAFWNYWRYETAP